MKCAKRRQVLLASSLATISLQVSAFGAVAATWINPSSSQWLDGSNWTGGVYPGTPGSNADAGTATFLTAPVANGRLDIDFNALAANDHTLSLGQIAYNSSVEQTFKIDAAPGTSGTLRFNGSNTVLMPFFTQSNITLGSSDMAIRFQGFTGGFFINNSNTLNLNGVISSTESSSTALCGGGGTVTLNANNTFSALSVNLSVVSVPAVADTGIASPIGNGYIIYWVGGTLRYTGTGDSTDRWLDMSTTIIGDQACSIDASGTGALAFTASQKIRNTSRPNSSLILKGSGEDLLAPPVPDAVSSGVLQPFKLAKSGAGTWTLSGSNSYSGGTTVSGGTLVLTKVNAAGTGSLAVSAGTAIFNTGLATAIKLKGASATGSGRIDLTDNDLVIDYTGASPISTVAAQLAAAYNSGAWTGAGITSSSAATVAADGANLHKTALGFAENSTFGLSVFSGVNVDSTAVLIRYTYYGDANLSGNVDSLDFNALAGSFGTSNKSWVNGDSNFDGSVDSLDFNALAANFGLTLPSYNVGSNPVPVPEPMSSTAIGVGCMILMSRRRTTYRRPAQNA